MERPLTCAACGKPLEGYGPTTEWEGQTVHRVCPGVDYTHLGTNPYHAHIFWNEVVPWGFYTYDEGIPWETIEAQAAGYGFRVNREDIGWGPSPSGEFQVLPLDWED